MMTAFERLRVGVLSLVVAGAIASSTTGALAQGGFGGGGMPPEIAAKIKLWQKYGEQHKHVTNLSLMMRQLEQLNGDPAYAFDKKQSAGMLTIMSKWKSKPAMSEDQATDVQKQIGALLTAKQIQKMSTFKGWGGGGGRPGGGGGFGGGGRPTGGGMPKFPDPPKGSYNPLNPDTMPAGPMSAMAKKGMDDFATDLQKKAK